MPSHGMSRAAMSIPTSGSTRGAGAARVSRGQKRSASSKAAPSHFSRDTGDAAQDIGQAEDQQQHPASVFYFVEGATTPPPAAQIPNTPAQRDHLSPPAGPPEPGGEEKGAFQPAYNRPWRKRAREARRPTVVLENTPELGPEGLGEGGSGDAMRQRASEKEEVVAHRKETKKKAMNTAALPIVDLVGIVSPLVIIVGMTIVQNAP